MDFHITKDWNEALGSELIKYVKEIFDNLKNNEFYPKKENIFRSLQEVDFNNVKVLIIGQDPYPNENACGLAFSTEEEKLPPSLKNIFDQIKNNTGIKNESGDLSSWAKQGVLLLNRALTIEYSLEKKCYKSDFKKWKRFIEIIISKLSNREKPLVVMLWGNEAQKLKSCIEKKDEIKILCASHPSNQGKNKTSSPFVSCKHFEECNKFLIKNEEKEIDWKTAKK